MINASVASAFSVQEAIKKIAEEKFDVIVSDFEMPIKNGLEFLKELKTRNIDIPFILFTGKGREEIAIQALNLGAAGYINKHGSVETVYGELTHTIQQAAMRKRGETKLHESEQLTQKIVDCTPNLIYIYDLVEHRNLYANKELAVFLGYTPEEIKAIGSSLFAKIMHPDDLAKVAKHHSRFENASENDVFEIEYRMKHANGEYRWLHSRDILFARTKEGRGKQILGTCQDITERRKSDLDLKEKYELLESLGENIDAGLAIIDKEFKVIWANKTLTDIGGVPGSLCYKVFAKANDVCPDCGVRRVFDEKIPVDVHEFKGINAKGEANWVELRVTPIKNSKGEVIAALELVVPIKERKQAEEKLEGIYQATPVATYTWQKTSEDFILVKFNRAADAITMGHASEFLGSKASEMYAANPSIIRDMTRCFRTKKPIKQKMEYFFRVTGQKKLLNVTYVYVPNDLLIVYTEDITERQKAEELIEESENKYRTLFSSMNEGVCLHEVIYDASGKAVDYRILDVNAAYVKLIGISKLAAVGKCASGLYGSQNAPYLDVYLKVAETGKPCSFTTYFPPMDKHFSISVFSTGKGKFATVFTDITEQVRINEKLEITSNLFDLATDAIYVFDLDGNIINFNQAAYKMTGYSKKELPKLTLKLLDTPKAAEQIDSRIKKISEFGKAVFESELKCKDKSILPIEVHARILESQGKKLVLSVVRDISERKTAERDREKLLNELEHRVKELDCLFNLSKLVEIPSISLDGLLQKAPEILRPAYRYPEVTAVKIVVETTEYVSNNFKESPWKLKSDIKLGHKNIGCVTVYYLEKMPTADRGPFFEHEKLLLDAVAERLSRIIERYRTNTLLIESEQRWATTLTSIGDAVIATDLCGKITFMNTEAEKLTGWSLSEATLQPLEKVFKIVNETSRKIVANPVTKVLKTGQIIGLANHTALISKSGTEIAIDDSGAPIRNANGKITGVVLVFRNIGNRRKVEQQVKETIEELKEANEKLRVVGSLTRHDVRNKLSGISASTFLLKRRAGSDPEIARYIENIEVATAMADRLFEFGKLYERIGCEKIKNIDVERCFNQAIALAPNIGDIKFFTDVKGLKVNADELLQQVFYNFIDNSIKHGKNVSAIRLRYSKENNRIRLYYEDNGSGISKTVKAKLFAEGFSTGGGSGLGLAMIKKILQAYGWSIKETGKYGKGVKFEMNIPNQNNKR